MLSFKKLSRCSEKSFKRFVSNKPKISITGVSVYAVDLPLHEGSYKWSEGKFVEVFDSTVVALHTNYNGIIGYGEVCPLGPFYLPAYSTGARTGIAALAPALIGQDPTQLIPMNRFMERTLKGHPYVKTAIDMACWDILGKVTGQPVSTLLGGQYDYDIPLYRAISQESPDEMAHKVIKYKKEGYNKFQLKVGGDPDTDIARIRAVRSILDPHDILVADANTGWLLHQAQRVVRAVHDVDVYIEQPCLTYQECLSVRSHSTHPFILDENIDGIEIMLRGYADHAMDCINIKISKFGGLTYAKQARDLAVTLGFGMILEDSWGGDIITAAIAHLAQSTPPQHIFAATDFNSYVTKSIANGAPARKEGKMRASNSPGLGVEPNMGVLGKPIYEI